MYFAKAAGTARFAYNWAKAKNQELYANGVKSSAFSMTALWNEYRKDNLPWSYEVTKWAGQRGVQNFYAALESFFKKKSKFPKFKKKGKSRDSFYLGVGTFKVEAKRIKIPNLGWVKMAQELRFPGKHLSVVVSREADDWYASIAVELDQEYKYPNQCTGSDVIGVDLGVGEHLAILSDGTKVDNPRHYRKLERKLKAANKSLSRKKKGSKNRDRAKRKLAKIHLKAKRRRLDLLHKTTSRLVKEAAAIGIETLNTKGMAKTKLAKSVHDASMFEFRRQLEYKSKLAGCSIVKADRFYPSSKLCSSCGFKLESLSLSVREWTCSSCGTLHDRDINAAKNLRNLAVRHTANQACGEGVRQQGLRTELLSSAKQESLAVSKQL